MDLGLQGKRAIVLGASRGLGAGVADALAAEGCDLVLAARRLDRLDEKARELSSAHAIKAESRRLDLGDRVSVEACAKGLTDQGGIDILVNNTGGPPPSGPLGVEPEMWLQQVQSMVLSVIRLTELLVPSMRERKWGRVLTITSSGVVQPIPNLAVSNTLRASLVAFMKTLSAEVAADGVTVNTIAPGRIWTERTDEIDAAGAERAGVSQDEIRARSVATIPVGRYGSVEEFAAVACFLVSARASYVTGQSMRVDGGLIRSI